jgi:hypothetical protein
MLRIKKRRKKSLSLTNDQINSKKVERMGVGGHCPWAIRNFPPGNEVGC